MTIAKLNPDLTKKEQELAGLENSIKILDAEMMKLRQEQDRKNRDLTQLERDLSMTTGGTGRR